MNALISKIGLLLVLATFSWACLNAPEYPDEPFIEFLSISKDTLDQGVFQEDSLTVRFHFEDGDGDIGRDDQGNQNNVFFIDQRTGQIDNTFGIPAIPQEGASRGVEGEVKIVLFTTCCIYTDGEDPCLPHPTVQFDTIQYKIYITDRANHRSNEIITPPIILRCN